MAVDGVFLQWRTIFTREQNWIQTQAMPPAMNLKPLKVQTFQPDVSFACYFWQSGNPQNNSSIWDWLCEKCWVSCVQIDAFGHTAEFRSLFAPRSPKTYHQDGFVEELLLQATSKQDRTSVQADCTSQMMDAFLCFRSSSVRIWLTPFRSITSTTTDVDCILQANWAGGRLNLPEQKAECRLDLGGLFHSFGYSSEESEIGRFWRVG